MDFSAWFEVYLEDRWWTFDARYNYPRFGHVLMAVGRDASDVATITMFGMENLTHFFVVSEELTQENARYALVSSASSPVLSWNSVRTHDESLRSGSHKIKRIAGHKG